MDLEEKIKNIFVLVFLKLYFVSHRSCNAKLVTYLTYTIFTAVALFYLNQSSAVLYLEG